MYIWNTSLNSHQSLTFFFKKNRLQLNIILEKIMYFFGFIKNKRENSQYKL